jgi:hypothetical protein
MICHGSSRIIATVPPEQREAVEVLLKEKLRFLADDSGQPGHGYTRIR